MGEGAIALMERVEEPPKVISTKHSPKSSRWLSILQSATICIAVILLVSGTYLTSISSVETFYDVYTGTAAGKSLSKNGADALIFFMLKQYVVP